MGCTIVKEIQRNTLGDYKSSIERYQKRRRFNIRLVLIVVLILGFTHLYKLHNSFYHTYKIVSSIPNNGALSRYISYRGGLIKYNKNGAIAYKNNGTEIWNVPYEMKDPIVDVCDKYAVISDREGKNIYIFNEKGLIGSFSTLYDILDVDIASQGVVAVQMYEGDNDFIQLYYEDGTVLGDNYQDKLLVDIKRNVMNNGYLMDIALSKNGKKLAVDFFSFTTENTLSNLGFFNYGEVGQNAVDNFMGGFPYKNVVIPKIEFLTNDVVCAFKDNGFMLYSMPQKPKLIIEKTFEHNIQSVFFSKKYIGVVLNEEATTTQLLLYNLKGEKILDRKLEFVYDKILLSGNDIIMYDNTTCLILRTNGKVKFNYTFNTNIEAIFPSDNVNKYMLVTDSKISEIALAKFKIK